MNKKQGLWIAAAVLVFAFPLVAASKDHHNDCCCQQVQPACDTCGSYGIGYKNGYEGGYDKGKADFEACAKFDNDDYAPIAWDKCAMGGDKSDYKKNYRRGWKVGYDDGYSAKPSQFAAKPLPAPVPQTLETPKQPEIVQTPPPVIEREIEQPPVEQTPPPIVAQAPVAPAPSELPKHMLPRTASFLPLSGLIGIITIPASFLLLWAANRS